MSVSMISTLPTFSQNSTFLISTVWLDQLASIPKSIVQFFIHMHADVRMLIRSYQSMTGVPPHVIQQRIDEVKRFIPILENCGENRTEVKESYLRLSPQVRGLFYAVDESYVDEFVKEPSNTQEILRECNRVIQFQRMLTSVNIFFRRFNGVTETSEAPPENNGGGVSPPVTPPPTRREEPSRPREQPSRPRVPVLPQFPWHDLLNLEQLLGNRQQEASRAPQELPRQEPPRNHHVQVQYEDPNDDPFLHDWWTDVREQIRQQQRQSERAAPPRPSRTVQQDPPINVNIDGTVAYVRGGIPADVQRKADEIKDLADRFEGLGRNKPAVPDIYMCNITKEPFMKIPLFDGSHPNVNNRDYRHYSEMDALEYYIRTKTHRAGTPQEYCEAKCSVCRHPEHGGIRRQYVRIDTELQDQILQFLRRAVNGGVPLRI